MSDKVILNLFGKPIIIFILGVIFAILFGNSPPTGQIIDVSPVIKQLSFIIFMLTTSYSSIWLLFSGYAYYSHYSGLREPCKHCNNIVGTLSHRCLHCHKNQWY
jgi:hypothetical protein